LTTYAKAQTDKNSKFSATLFLRTTKPIIIYAFIIHSSHILRRRVRVGGPRRERVAGEPLRKAAGRHPGRGRLRCPPDANARTRPQEVSDSVWRTSRLDTARKDKDDRPPQGQKQDPAQETLEPGALGFKFSSRQRPAATLSHPKIQRF
jgi:hypothetical protein